MGSLGRPGRLLGSSGVCGLCGCVGTGGRVGASVVLLGQGPSRTPGPRRCAGQISVAGCRAASLSRGASPDAHGSWHATRARCARRLARCTLPVARCSGHAARPTPHAALGPPQGLRLARCTLRVARCALHVARGTSHVAWGKVRLAFREARRYSSRFVLRRRPVAGRRTPAAHRIPRLPALRVDANPHGSDLRRGGWTRPPARRRASHLGGAP